MSNQNSIAVIIPAYNAEKYIGEAINSVHCQNNKHIKEIIVIDDGSEDNTVSIAKKLGTTVVDQQHLHAAAARNNGVKHASSEWVFFLDSDDVLTNGAINTILNTAIRENLDGVFTFIKDFVSPELPEKEKGKLVPRPEPYSGAIGDSTFVRRTVFQEIGYFDETLSSGEGIDWLMRFKNSNLKTKKINFVSAKRRLHMTNTGRINKKQEVKNIAAALRKIRTNK